MTDPRDESGSSGIEPASVSSSLMNRLKAQDPEAWERMVGLYYPLVYGWCRRRGLQPQDAADVVQDVFRSVHTALERFHRNQPGESFRGWLYGITRHKLVDYWRKQENAVDGRASSDGLSGVFDSQESEADSSKPSEHEATGLMRRALELVRAEFEPRTWQAFWRVSVDGCSAAETARELSVSVNVVYLAKSRVLRRLREELDGSDLS